MCVNLNFTCYVKMYYEEMLAWDVDKRFIFQTDYVWKDVEIVIFTRISTSFQVISNMMYTRFTIGRTIFSTYFHIILHRRDHLYSWKYVVYYRIDHHFNSLCICKSMEIISSIPHNYYSIIKP